MSPKKKEGTGTARGGRTAKATKGKTGTVRKKGSVQEALSAALRPEPDDGFVDVPDDVVNRGAKPQKKGTPQKRPSDDERPQAQLPDGKFDGLRARWLSVNRHLSASSGDANTVGPAPVLLADQEGATSLRLREANELHTYLGELDGKAGLWIGKDDDRPGRIVVRAGDAQARVVLDAADCAIKLRSAEGLRAVMHSTADGCSLSFFDDQVEAFTHFGDWDDCASLILGGYNRLPGRITLRRGAYENRIVLDAESGDIVLTNADCAEEFDVAEDAPPPEAGTVLVLDDEPGRLRVSATAYDTRVAGIVSGAGDYKHAIVLDRRPDAVTPRVPVALMGKVYCRVEADSAPVVPGTLLTTSDRPGTAMAATERDRAFGAVLGKALAPLGRGTAMLPVLVTLQ